MELIKILQGLGSNDPNKRDELMGELKFYLNAMSPIENKEELQDRLNIFIRIWNCIFYCKLIIKKYLRLLEY